MKLKKIFVNILVSADSFNEFNEKITMDDISKDILGFHVVIKNNIQNDFTCEFIAESDQDLYWSIDRKQTKTKCLIIEYNTQKCRINVEANKDIDLFIWSENGNEFNLKSVRNIKTITENETLDSIMIHDKQSDQNFTKIFGFEKKYHFDQYRMLLVIGLCNSDESNSKFIKDMVIKIVGHAKEERRVEMECTTPDDFGIFFTRVFNNLLEENCGTIDKFREYREKILNKLRLRVSNLSSTTLSERFVGGETKILTNRKFKDEGLGIIKKFDVENHQIEMKEKNSRVDKYEKIMNNPFEKNKMSKIFNYSNINDDIFVVVEYSRKGVYFEPFNSIILYKYKDIRFADIEQTIEKIVINCSGESYEILLYFDNIGFINNFEKIVDGLFFNYDNLFRIKIITPKSKLGNISKNLTDIQKLIILSNFPKAINENLFLVGIGSIFPKKYMNYINVEVKKNSTNNDTIFVLNKCNMLNRTNGKIELYETNQNKMFNYFVECLFPVIPKVAFAKLNFKSQFLASFERFKDFKNFLMKNGTIVELKIISQLPEKYLKEALHVYEN